MPLRDGFVDLDGLRIHHTWGGRGSPVLLIHGLGSAASIEWRLTLGPLSATHRVFAPDLPGQYAEGSRVAYDIGSYAMSLDRYLRSQGLPAVAVVGISLGGRIAIEMALRHPRLVERLILVNSLGVGRPAVHPFFPLLMLPGVGEVMLGALTAGLRWAPAGWVKGVASRSGAWRGPTQMDDIHVENLGRLYAEPGFSTAYLKTVRSLSGPQLLTAQPLLRRMRRLKMPIGLIWGACDHLFPVETARIAHRELPGSKLVVIEGAGHALPAERPAEFNSVLLEMLAGW